MSFRLSLPFRRAALFSGTAVALSGCLSSAPWRGPAKTASSGLPTPVASSVTPTVAAAAPQDSASPDEVVRTAVAVFGDSMAVAAADSAATEPEWDIDVRSYETHDRVAHYVNLFSTGARERFAARLSAGTRYEPMIRAKLRASGMPEDLTYLALIESGYDPHAYSRAAAVGMWQFMSSTARDVGMRVDWWVDDRRDPARATDGAIRFLGYLQKQFGSFYLAAAAYNGGPGRVARGLTRFAEELEGAEGDDRFFVLASQDYLHAETKNYVPQLIAAALIAKTPDRYGIVLDTLPLYAYDSVSVGPGTSLAAVSRASGTDSKELRALNPSLLRGVAPPDAPVWVRLPMGTAELTRMALDTMTSIQGYTTSKITGTTTTAAGLANKHGVTLKQLRWYNPSLKVNAKGRLTAGQTVRIPDRSTIAYAFEVPDPSIERYGTGTSASLQSRGVHVVRRGETLGGIARRYGISQSRLQAMNGMRGTRLIAGQSLQVSGGTRTASSTPTKATPAKASASKASAAKAKAKPKTPAKATTAKAKAKPAAKATASKPAASKSKAAAPKKKAPVKASSRPAAKSGTAKSSTSKSATSKTGAA